MQETEVSLVHGRNSGALRPARIYLSPPHMSPRERELLLEAFDSNWIAPLGPQVDAFETRVRRRVSGWPTR